MGGRRTRAALDLRRSALPESALADVLRHRGLVADLRPHVPALRHAVRVGLDREGDRRLPVPRGGAGGSVGARRGQRVRVALRAARAARRDVCGADRPLPRRGPAALRRELPGLVARPSAARDRAQLRLPRRLRDRGREPRRAGRAARGCHRHPRSALEDPLDAQLRPVLRDHGAERHHRGGRRQRRCRARGPAAELGRGPQLGLDRGPLAHEDGGGERRRACAPRSPARRRPRCWTLSQARSAACAS